MKMITIISFILFYAIDICAQTETFDLTTFTPPKGWTKEVKENFISFTKTDDAKITLYYKPIKKQKEMVASPTGIPILTDLRALLPQLNYRENKIIVALN